MTLAWTLAALAISLPALYALRWTDPKRRRILELPMLTGQRRTVLPWLGVFLPGIVLFVIGASAALIIWLAALTVLGWLLAQHRRRASSAVR